MRQLQVTVPSDQADEAKGIIKDYSSDVNSSNVEKDDYNAIEITATVESEDIDGLTDKLKNIDDIESGRLSIRVLEQESLIKKGQKTKGSFSALSQKEIYSKAQEAGQFNMTQWSLIAASSAIAALGMASNSIIAVIGAMMLAPMLAPFIASSISLSIGDSSLMKKSLLAGTGSILLALITSIIVSLPIEFTQTQALTTVLSPGVLALPLSIIVGAAAALSFTTGFRDQIAGVAVAIALVPPIAAAGLTFSSGRYLLGFKALNLAVMNALSVLVAGYVCLKAFGLHPSTYYKKKSAESMKRVVPVGIIVLMLLGIPLSFSVYDGAEVEPGVQSQAEDVFGDDLIEVRRSEGDFNIFVAGNYSEENMSSNFDSYSVEIISLEQK